MLKAVAIFLICVVAILGAIQMVGSSSCEHPPKSYSEATAAEEPNKYNCPTFYATFKLGLFKSWDFIHESHEEIIAVATIFIAIFTIILGLFTVTLAGSTRDLVNGAEITAERQLRAYVFAFSADIGDRGRLHKMKKVKELNGFLGSFCVIKNSGQTPAYKVVHWSAVDVRKISEENTLTVPLPLHQVSASTIPPGGINNATRFRPEKLTDEQIEAIKAATSAIYVYGRIEYIDAFTKRRFTNYRLKYSGAYPPPPNITMSFCDSGNETDDHKN